MLLAVFCACGAEPAVGMERSLTLAQLQHTNWTSKDGVPIGAWQIEQTQDGWIWIAGANGLYRFDGVKFARVAVPSRSGSESPAISVLEAGPSGELWIALMSGGVTRIRGSRLDHYGESSGLGREAIQFLLGDTGGTAWAATREAVYRFDGQRWEKLDASWNVDVHRIQVLRLDAKGTLWLVGSGRVQYLPAEAKQFKTLPTSYPDAGGSQVVDGNLWLFSDRVAYRMPTVVDGPVKLTDAVTRRSHSSHFLDRDNNLWSVFCPAGVCWTQLPLRPEGDRIHFAAPSQTFSTADGLSGDVGRMIMEDRNGSIWVLTALGLDRFRRPALVPVTLPRASTNFGLAPNPDGSVTVTSYSPSSNTVWNVDQAARLVNAPGEFMTAAHRTRDGTLWLGGQPGIWRQTRDGWSRVAAPEGTSSAELLTLDSDPSALWAYFGGIGIFRYRTDRWEPVDTGAPPSASRAIKIDASNRAWIAMSDNRLVVFEEGVLTRRFGAEDGIDVGGASQINVGPTVVLVGEVGVDVLVGKRFARLRLDDPEAALGVTGVAQLANGDLWLNGRKGAVLIRYAELKRLEFESSPILVTRIFDVLDGYPVSATAVRPRPSLIEGRDGRLWFAGVGGVSYLVPSSMEGAGRPAEPLLLGLFAGGRSHVPDDAVALAPRTTGVAISFTSLGATLPERARFSFRLDDVDKDWRNSEGRREASYSNLGPGRYRFRVRVDPAVDEPPGPERSVEFTIRPTLFETPAFAVACFILAAIALWRVATLRARRAASRAREKLQDRLEERGRIARELHDTLLQGMQGLVMRIHAITRGLPTADKSREELERVLQSADKALLEVREGVTRLRDSSADSTDLGTQIARIGDELMQEYPGRFSLNEVGDVRDLKPAVHGELLRISSEAILNAFRHSGAAEIRVELRYGFWHLRLEVRDNGQGIPSDILTSGRPGHWGLAGLRERASVLSAKLRIVSNQRHGTRIALRMPGRKAYRRRSPS